MKTQLLILLALAISCFAELAPNQHYTGEMNTDGSVKAEAEIILKGLSPKDKFLANILWTPGAELQLTATITKTIKGGVRFVYRDHFGNKGNWDTHRKPMAKSLSFLKQRKWSSQEARASEEIIS